MKGGRKGFTLIELVIVMGLLAIVAVMVMPLVRSTEVHALEAAARVLAADLRLARSQAIAYNTEWTARFDLTGNTYELVHSGTGNPPPLRNPLAPPALADGPYRVALDGPAGMSRGGPRVRLGGVVLSDSRQPAGEVTFGPVGGTGPQRSEDTLIWLISGVGPDTRAVSLTVSWITGQVWIGRVETE